jgi:DNA-binding transcriptional MerR regulator
MYRGSMITYRSPRETVFVQSHGMKVGELAKRTGLSVRTLHYYDEIGLLQASQVTESRHRVYGAAELRRLQQIKSLRQLGSSLDEIRGYLDTPEFSPRRVLSLHVARLREQKVRAGLISNPTLMERNGLDPEIFAYVNKAIRAL